MSISGGEGEPPHKTATTIADFVAGTNAATAICAALVGRSSGGGGRLVEVSLRDGLIAVQAGWNAQFFAMGRPPPRTGTASPVTAPNQTFRTSDGYVNLAVVSDRHFLEVCRLLELGQIAEDDRYAHNDSRVENRQSLTEVMESVLTRRSTDHWIEVFVGAGLAAGRLLDLSAVFDDPQAIHNEMVVEMEHQAAGTIKVTGSPLRLDDEPARAASAPPVLGADTRSVMERAGLSEGDIDRLASAGLLLIGPPD
jgi:CoA:oxalate CoA-transferase